MLFIAFALAAGVQSQPQPQAQPVPPQEQQICRKEIVTGSLSMKKICMTRLQWERLDRDNENDANEALDSMRSRSAAGISRQ